MKLTDKFSGVKVFDIINRYNIETVEQAQLLTDEQLLKCRHVGPLFIKKLRNISPEQPEAQKKHPRLEELRKNIPDDVKREVDAMFEQQNQPQPEKVDDVQWQDIMTTAAGIEPEKDSDTSTITGMIKTVIEICKEHAEDGCFDAEGAEANAIRILTRKQTPNP